LSPYSLYGVIPAIRLDLSPFPLMVAHSAVLPFKNYSAIVAIWTWRACKTGFPVTSDPEAGASHRQVDHCGAVRGDRAHAKETWSQARLGEKRVALA
jgi:hypothetical protein